jgi:DNA polymerase II small subunit/DNA polymerase delta subunit B
LKKFPCVQVIDSAGDSVDGIVEYISNEELTITFSAAFSGAAYLN